jgi:hypothetical protein
VDVVILVPPLFAVYQPLNVYPVLVEVGRVPKAVPYVFVIAVPFEPPLPSKDAVYEFFCQIAYNFTAALLV